MMACFINVNANASTIFSCKCDEIFAHKVYGIKTEIDVIIQFASRIGIYSTKYEDNRIKVSRQNLRNYPITEFAVILHSKRCVCVCVSVAVRPQ